MPGVAGEPSEPGPRDRQILFFGWRPWPNDHAVLETVYGRELPALGWRTTWVLPPASPGSAGVRGEWLGQSLRVARFRTSELTRHLGLLRDYLRLGREALGEGTIDVVQARTGPIECLAAALLARAFRRPLVIQLSFPSTARRRARAAALGRWSAFSARVEEALQMRALRQASLILAVSEAMRASLRADGLHTAVSFPLGADTTLEPSQVPKASLGDATILYFGSLAPEREVPLVVRAFARMAAHRSTARLALLGALDDRRIPAEIERVGLSSRVDILPPVPRADVPSFIRAACLTVSAIPPTETYLVSSPTKVLESLAMATPVVANREIQDQREVIEASGGGILTEYDESSIAAAMDSLLERREDARAAGDAGRRWVDANRSYRALATRVRAEYERVVRDGV